jgi:hypothetical protein
VSPRRNLCGLFKVLFAASVLISKLPALRSSFAVYFQLKKQIAKLGSKRLDVFRRFFGTAFSDFINGKEIANSDIDFHF